MSRVGDCRDNAVAESFFATPKTKLIHRRPWPTEAEARGVLVAARASLGPANGASEY